MNMTQNELKLIIDGQDGIREELGRMIENMQQGFARVHTRIDDTSKLCSVVCIQRFATKEDLAYVDGRISETKGSVGRAWQVIRLTAGVAVIAAAEQMVEHSSETLAGIFKFCKWVLS